MMFLNQESNDSILLEEVIEAFQDLAEPMYEKGDIDGIHSLYAKAYAQVMKGIKPQSLEKMRAEQLMQQALHDVLTRPARERRRYFEAYRGRWWRSA